MLHAKDKFCRSVCGGGGKHQFMIKGNLRVRIPNPHKTDVGKNLLNQILMQADIDKHKWESL